MTRKTALFDRWSRFKFNNLGLALGTKLKFYNSVAKGLKLKVRKFWGLSFPPPSSPPILNRVNILPECLIELFCKLIITSWFIIVKTYQGFINILPRRQLHVQSNRSTGIRWEICSKLAITAPEGTKNLLLSLNIFHTLF